MRLVLPYFSPPITHANTTLIKGAAYLWWADGGHWVRRALTDLIEGGDVRELFSDSELLELAAAEEEHNHRRKGITDIAGAGGLKDGGSTNVVGAPTARGVSGVNRADGVERAHREDGHEVGVELWKRAIRLCKGYIPGRAANPLTR